ncbi:MAG: VWA domain-containing protein [Nocardioidaceae bacterium]
MVLRYPFSAVVGSDDLALALVLTTVSPAVGGVLVRGEKGTAKSTMVRALASLLPPVAVVDGCRFACDPLDPDPACPDGPHVDGARQSERPARLVELPVGAGEDRVIGSLHLEKALSAGVTEYEPGLLAAAHRGLLYVDEVNLLHDHLVDLLLDAAAMGRSTVERDGVSVTHASRFVLVGTMNPEEGELRPQLLDRFGLTVEVAASRDPHERAEVVRRRLAFEADPAGFVAGYADAEQALSERIAKARAALPAVVLGDAALASIAKVCAAFEVDGLRADIVTARAAIAHAAWSGRGEVTAADVRVAARLAIPHRRRRNPFDAPGLDEDRLDDLLDDDRGPDDDGPGDGPDDGGGPDDAGPDDGPHDATEPQAADPNPDSTHPEPPLDAPQPTTQHGGGGEAYRTRLFAVGGTGRGEAGRRSRARTSTGRTVGARPDARGPVHLPATVRAAAPHQRARGRADGRLLLHPTDVRRAVAEGRESNQVLLCVDATGSMAARRRMEQVKTAVLSLLLDAYQRRDRVGLVTFRGAGATLVLPPTGSVDVAAARLGELPAGGRTPLAEGLARAADVLRVERLKTPDRRPLLVVVTDGRATHGADAVARSQRAAAHLAAQGVAGLVVDCESGGFRMGLAGTLAGHLGAQHVPVGEVSADAITDNVRRSIRKGAA